jgi:hypothetical protein
MDDPDLKLFLGILGVLVLGALGWFFRDAFLPEPEAEPAIEQPLATEGEQDSGPRHPLPSSTPGESPQGELVELPPLDDSDAFFLLEIANSFHPAFEALLVREAVIDRLVATIDNLPRAKIVNTIRPVTPLPDAFAANDGDNGTSALGPFSYQRYDAIVAQIYYVDIDTAYDTYQRFYPLFQKAYERLGYPNAYFNDRLVEVIDHLTATPVPEEPIVLTRPNVLYEFEDPNLEALSSGQKLMLRMGPDNAATVKRKLEKFRARLVDTD